MELLDLPDELLIVILSNLDPPSFQKCKLVCKLFKSLMDDSTVLQYIMALNQAGYVDGPSTCTISTAERLRRLQHHQSAWKDLEWRRIDSYDIPHRTGTYELYGGVYAQGLESLVDASSEGTGGLELIEFPSLLRNQTEGHKWRIPDFGFDVKDFGMDPDKDLLVLMEKAPKKTATTPNPPLAVHLLALRDPDANPHPLAEHPILYYQPPIWNRKYHYWVQVVGDVLAVMFIPEVRQQDEAIADQLLDELVIWKWKTGKAVTSIRCEPGYEAGSFAFLTNDIVVIPCTKDEKYPELRLYQLPTTTTSSQASPSTSEPSNLLAIFHFPEFTNSVRQCGIMCRADPSPWAPPPRNPVHRNAKSSEKDYDAPIWPAHGAAPFAPHPSNRLLVITLDIVTVVRWPTWGMPQLQGQQALSRKHTAFTTAEVLLRAWKKGLETRETEGLNLADGCSVVELPWEDWGPTGTRMLSEATDPSAVCYVYGLRYIRLVAMGENEDRAVHIRLMDFNDREFDRVYHEDAVAQTAGAEEEFARSEGACGAPEAPEAPETSTPIGINEGASESGSETHEEAETEQLVIADDDGDSDWVDEDEDAEGEEESEEEEEEEEIDDEDLNLEAEDNSSRRTLRQRRQDAIPGFGDLCILGPEEKARCERTSVALHESYVEDILVFKNRITTTLPFRWSFKTAPEVQRWTSCMLDDEHIIGLKRTQRVALDEIAVSVDILTL